MSQKGRQAISTVSDGQREIDHQASCHISEIEGIVDSAQGVADEVENLKSRFVGVGEATTRIEKRVDSKTRSLGFIHKAWAKFRVKRIGRTAKDDAAGWYCRVILVPSLTQPFAFEAGSTAYRRCQSRGLHQDVHIKGHGNLHFIHSVEAAFATILRGRSWVLLCEDDTRTQLARISINRLLRDSRFVVTNELEGVIIYIALLNEDLSWSDIRSLPQVSGSDESVWAHDDQLDGQNRMEGKMDFPTVRDFDEQKHSPPPHPSSRLPTVPALVPLAVICHNLAKHKIPLREQKEPICPRDGELKIGNCVKHEHDSKGKPTKRHVQLQPSPQQHSANAIEYDSKGEPTERHVQLQSSPQQQQQTQQHLANTIENINLSSTESSPDRSVSEHTSDEEAESDSEFSEGDNMINPLLNTMKQEMVNRIMAEFLAMFGADTDNITTSNPGRSSSNPTETTSSTTLILSGLPISHGVRHSKGRRGSNSSNGDDGDDQRKRPRIQSSPPQSFVIKPKFACPFFKRNAEKHQRWRSCAGPGWSSVHRVKEHVYRRHSKPVSCPRCCAVFDAETDLVAHSRSQTICEIREVEPVEGYDKEQEKKLKSRKKPTGQTEEARWREMYRILFPQDDEATTPNPYYEYHHLKSSNSGNFTRYEEYARNELPRRVRQMVENLIQSKYGPIEESVKAQLTEIIHRCQEDVFQSFRMFQLGPSNNQNELEGMTTSGENSLLCQQGQDLEPIFAPPPPISDDLTLPTIQDVEMSRSQWAGIEAVNSSDSAYSSLELFKHSEEEFLNFNWLEAGPNFPQTNEHAREGANETAPESHTFRRPPAPN